MIDTVVSTIAIIRCIDIVVASVCLVVWLLSGRRAAFDWHLTVQCSA